MAKLKAWDVKPVADLWISDSLRGRFVRGAVWSVVATVLSQGIVFICFAIAAHILTKTAFGELGMIQSTVGLFGVFAGLGLGLTATKHVAEYRESDAARAGRIISLTLLTGVVTGGVVTVILALWSPSLAADVLNAPHLGAELRIGCVLLFLNTVDGVQLGALMGFEAFSLIARTNVFRGLANLTLVVSGVYFWGLRGALVGLVGAAAIGLLINHVALKALTASHGISITHRGLAEDLSTLWGYSLPAFLSGAVIAPAGWLARAFLVNQPGGYAELAVFTVASRFQDMVGLAGSTIGAALVPMLASKSGSRSERLAKGNILLSWTIGTAMVLPLLVFPEVVGALFGGQYATRDAVQTLVLILLASSIVMYKQGLARVLAASGLLWWSAASNLTWAVILVVSAWGGAVVGARGLAAAVLVAYALSSAVFMPLYLRKRLAPSSLLASPCAMSVWAMLLALAALAYIGASVTSRSFAGTLCLVGLFFAFRRLSTASTQEVTESSGVVVSGAARNSVRPR